MSNIEIAHPSTEMPVFLDRPAAGGLIVGPVAAHNLSDELANEAKALRGLGGGLLKVVFDEDQETTMLLLLNLVQAKLKMKTKGGEGQKLDVRVHLQNRDAAVVDIPAAGYVLIHNLPTLPAWFSILESEPEHDLVIVATGSEQGWAHVDTHIRQRLFRPFDRIDNVSEDQRTALLEDQWSAYSDAGFSEQGRKAYGLAALFDAWGVPLPVDLLARALDVDEERVDTCISEAEERSLLYWLELERPAALLVATRAPLVARQLVGQLMTPDDVLNGYRIVLGAIDREISNERYTALKLFQSILNDVTAWQQVKTAWRLTEAHRGWLRLLMKDQTRINTFWQKGNAVEHLLWGKLYEALGDFIQSDWIFAEGLRRWPDNRFLLHARARMLGTWAHFSRGKLQRARDAFKLAQEKAPGSPYVLQAWGVMEAGLGNSAEARAKLQEAIAAARRDIDRVHVCVAYADLEAEAGNYGEAERYLDEAEELVKGESKLIPSADARSESQARVEHLRARNAFYQGHFDAAVEKLNTLIAAYPLNVLARHTLGDIHLKRGHWDKAEEAFRGGLALHAENVLLLHSLGELFAERDELAVAERRRDMVLSCHDEARKCYDRIRELEPLNAYAAVSESVLLRKRVLAEPGKEVLLRDAEALLRQVLQEDPHNLRAHQELGELWFQQGKLADAEDKFKTILAQTQHKSSSVAALAALVRINARQGWRTQALDYLERLRGMVAAAHEAWIQEAQRPMHCHELIHACNTLVECLIEIKDLEEARAWIKRSQGLDQDGKEQQGRNAYTLRLLAKLHEAKGDYSAAREARARRSALGMTVQLCT